MRLTTAGRKHKFRIEYCKRTMHGGLPAGQIGEPLAEIRENRREGDCRRDPLIPVAQLDSPVVQSTSPVVQRDSPEIGRAHV